MTALRLDLVIPEPGVSFRGLALPVELLTDAVADRLGPYLRAEPDRTTPGQIRYPLALEDGHFEPVSLGVITVGLGNHQGALLLSLPAMAAGLLRPQVRPWLVEEQRADDGSRVFLLEPPPGASVGVSLGAIGRASIVYLGTPEARALPPPRGG